MIETKQYGQGNSHSCFCGVSLDEPELKINLPTKVKDRLYDIEGTNELINTFDSLVKTGFESQILIDIFKSNINPVDWKIGEAMVECYLEENKRCKFYYESSRDAKNSKANLSGADLVGFVEVGNDSIFLFGEVKTSNDTATPPNVLYGRSGMIQQLENLKNDSNVSNDLIRWLGFKVCKLSDKDEFRQKYENALKIYVSNNSAKIKLIGVLVRDTAPDQKDLVNRFTALAKDLDANMNLELIALYLPIKINDLRSIMEKKDGN